MFSTTVLAGNILQTATAPEVGITAKVIQPLTGSLEITLKSAPEDLDFGQTDYIKFYITSNYPETVRIIPMGNLFNINNELTVNNSSVQGKIVTSQVFLYNANESFYLSATTFDNFVLNGILIPANTTTVLRIPVTMPGSELSVLDQWNNNILYTVARGDSLNLNLVVNVEEN